MLRHRAAALLGGLPVVERRPRPALRLVPAEPALRLVLGQPAQDLIPHLAHREALRVVCGAKGQVLQEREGEGGKVVRRRRGDERDVAVGLGCALQLLVKLVLLL